MAKCDYELVVIDDMSREDVLSVMKRYKGAMRMQYIRIDHTQCNIPSFAHTPALSNNVGFRNARGDVVAITQPEVLHSVNNLKLLYEGANKGFYVHGDVLASDLEFVSHLDEDKTESWREMSFEELTRIPGAAGDSALTSCLRQGLFWYVAAVKRDLVYTIRGVDEEYLRGVCAEDDNFRERIALVGAKPRRDPRIRAIHQSHQDEGKQYGSNRDRTSKEWRRGAEINRARLRDWFADKKAIANEDHEWGDPSVIVNRIVIDI